MSLVGAFVIVAFVFQMPPVAIAAVYLVYVAPRIILDLMIRRRRALLRDQMVAATIALANSSRAGLSLAQGLETVGEETPEPLAYEIRRVVHEYKHGRPLAEALRAAKDRLNIDSFTLFAAAVLVSLDAAAESPMPSSASATAFRKLNASNGSWRSTPPAGKKSSTSSLAFHSSSWASRTS